MTSGPDPGVYISPAQMYQEMRSLHDALTRIDAKLDALRDDNTSVREDLADHESRLRSLERGRWPLPTVAALAGTAGAATGLIALLR